jgi:hypothetical protein
METINTLENTVEFQPTYSVFKSETTQKPLLTAGLYTEAIRQANFHGYNSYVVRRSFVRNGTEYLRGMVVYSKRG